MALRSMSALAARHMRASVSAALLPQNVVEFARDLFPGLAEEEEAQSSQGDPYNQYRQ